MNDDDKKMIEEAEKLAGEMMAPGAPWVPQTFYVEARRLLPALAKRLREALEEIEHRKATADSQKTTGFETARREAIAAIQKLPEWPVVDARAKKRTEVDRLKEAYPVKEGEEIGEYLERVAKAEGGSSFCEHANEVPSQCPCSSSCYCKLHTCRQTALAQGYKVAFEGALADLRVAVGALEFIRTHGGVGPSNEADGALQAIKTKGLR